jgi:hypothetical protein
LKGLEHLPVVREFAYIFLEELPGILPKRELDFTIDLKRGSEPIARMPYRMSTGTDMSKHVTVGCANYFHTKEGWVVEALH